MKDEFNLEQVLGRIAAVLSGKGHYREVEEPLKVLIKHADEPDALDTFKETVEVISEKAGAQEMLSMLHGLAMLAPEQELQNWLVEKWKNVLAAAPEDEKFFVTRDLQHAAGTAKEGDPLEKLALHAWSESVDPAKLESDTVIRVALAIDSNVTNAAYRLIALDKLRQLKDRKPDLVLEILTDIIDDGTYASFRDNDAASAAVLFGTMADILENNKDRYAKEKTADISRKIFVTGAKKNAKAELTAAKIYMGLAAAEPDDIKRFDMYCDVAGRRTAAIWIESDYASFMILDLVDSGAIPMERHSCDDTLRTVAERIFRPVINREPKNEDLAACAAASLVRLVRTKLSGADTTDSLAYYDAALQLLEYFEPDDPQVPEVFKLWKEGLVRNFKDSYQKDFFARQMGAMLDISARKGNTETAEWARQQWREVMETITKGRPYDGYRTVLDITVNEAHYGENSELVKEAQKLLPDYEKRAGIVKHPDTVSKEDFKKLLQQKRGPKPRI